jgi:isoleucyl-tRNA synthetase
MTDELKLEGLKREIVRLVNNLRKNARLTIQDRIVLSWQSDSELIKNVFVKMSEELKKDTLSEKIVEAEGEIEVKVNGEKVNIGIKKI